MGAYGEYSSRLCNFGGFKLVTNLEETKEAKCKSRYSSSASCTSLKKLCGTSFRKTDASQQQENATIALITSSSESIFGFVIHCVYIQRYHVKIIYRFIERPYPSSLIV